MNQYSKRREKVLKSLKTNTAIMLFSGKQIYYSEDDAYEFKVNRNFYYLTGIDAQDMVLLMYNIDGAVYECIYIRPYDAKLAKWVGGRMLPEEVKKISEIYAVDNIENLDESVANIINRNRKDSSFKFLFDFYHYEMDQQASLAIEYANKLKEKYPFLIVKDIYPLLTHLRLIKDEYEINCIQKAIHTTNLGIQQMLRTAKPGVNEMTMEGVFDFVLRQSLCKENSFKTIAASGKRATILHYSDNDQVMKDGELFLCDLGATYGHYCADISRTFPVNGKFTPRQKELYAIVLSAQKIVERSAKVGVKLKDLNNLVLEFYKVELPKHGLTKPVSKYYYHSVSHHLGLDTHDVDGGMGATLEAGNIITNEPGLYIPEEGVGIRIEDDLLITGTGCVNLSKEIIKEVVDIENFMQNGQ